MSVRPHIVTAALLAGCLAATTAGPAAGQVDGNRERGDGAGGPELSVSAAVLAPLTRLTESDVSFDTEVSTAVGVSAGAGWWLGRHLGVAARAVWAPAQLNLRGVSPGAAVPDDLGDATYLAGTLDVTYRFRPTGAASLLEPFLTLGAGVRDLSLQPQASPEARSATDLAGSVSAGTYVGVWEGASLRLEVRDLISEFDSTETGEGKVQHDVVISIGGSVRP